MTAESADRQDLIDSYLKQVSALKAKVSSLSSNQQPSATLANDWGALQPLLASKALPRMGPAVRLAASSMMALIGSVLAAVLLTDGITGNPQVPGNAPQQFRQVWSHLLVGQLGELERLLKDPPEISAPAAAATSAPAEEERPDREGAKSLLDEAVTEANSRESSIRTAAYRALYAGVLCIVAAAALPFVLGPEKGTVGWEHVAIWGARILGMAALVTGAVHLFNVFRDMMGRAANATRERMLLRALAASAALGTGKEQAAALVELVRALSQPVVEADKGQALVIPPGLLKELPELVKLFKAEK